MPIPVTAEGKRRVEAELAALVNKLPHIRTAIAEAREKGDLRENAEYHAAREELGYTEGRVSELRGKLAEMVVVDQGIADKDQVAFGATLELEDLSDGSVEEWCLVGAGEDDPLANRILTTSPMGQALLGHKVGDAITFKAPIGLLSYKIISIRY